MIRRRYCVALVILLAATGCDGGTEDDLDVDPASMSSDATSITDAMGIQDLGLDSGAGPERDADTMMNDDQGPAQVDGAAPSGDTGPVIELDAAP